MQKAVRSNTFTTAVITAWHVMQRTGRSIFAARGSFADATVVLPGEKACFALAFDLPAALPPSFAGTAARFAYSITATCQVVCSSGDGSTAGDTDGVRAFQDCN